MGECIQSFLILNNFNNKIWTVYLYLMLSISYSGKIIKDWRVSLYDINYLQLILFVNNLYLNWRMLVWINKCLDRSSFKIVLFSSDICWCNLWYCDSMINTTWLKSTAPTPIINKLFEKTEHRNINVNNFMSNNVVFQVL